MRCVGFWIMCGLTALSGGIQAHEHNVGGSSGKLDPIKVGVSGDPNFVSGPLAGALLYLAGDGDRSPAPADMIGELAALRARLSALWNPPVGAKDPQELAVEISMKLKPDGTLVEAPTVLTRGESPLFNASRDSALKAIYRGQPFSMLRPEHCDQWKEIVVTFDARHLPPR